MQYQELEEWARMNRGSIGASIRYDKEKIAKSTIINNMIDRTRSRIASLEELYLEVDQFLSSATAIYKTTVDKKREYEKERLQFIKHLVETRIARVFPKENYSVDFVYDFGTRQEAYLKLTTPSGRVLSSDLGVGMLLQYLLSYSTVDSILEALGSDIILFDEAFSVSSKENKEEISKILDERVQEGMCTIAISQDSKLYEDIPHRIWRLEENPETLQMELAEVIDKEREIDE